MIDQECLKIPVAYLNEYIIENKPPDWFCNLINELNYGRYLLLVKTEKYPYWIIKNKNDNFLSDDQKEKIEEWSKFIKKFIICTQNDRKS